MLTCVWGGQNALFKIAAKQYLTLLMMLDFEGGLERFVEDSHESIFKTLDNA